jgi:cyclase
MKGYDINLINRIKKVINIPLTVLGGAGKLEDIKNIFKEFGIIGASAGSLFVFKGKYRAVLINYPSFEEKKLLFTN